MNKNPIVFTDFHHAGLLNSLIILFEKRLGGKVYRPIGREWFEKGYWKIYDHPATVAQYLDIGGATPDGTPKLNEVDGHATYPKPGGGFQDEPYVYFCRDIESNSFNNAITYQGFMDTPIDIVIASIPAHVESFKKLCADHPNKPKLIFQIGNAWTMEAAYADNIMSSAIIDSVNLRETNFVLYHQEFNTNIFYPDLNSYSDGKGNIERPEKNIFSFVNLFSAGELFAEDFSLFRQVEQALFSWNFKSYGGQCRDGSCDGSLALAQKMHEARFIWHTKKGGDGYGHVIHNAAAVARPMIVKKSYYFGKLADQLLIDGITCINIDNLSVEQIVAKINYYSEPERYKVMCQAVTKNFKEVCNFDEDFEKIKVFLEKLK